MPSFELDEMLRDAHLVINYAVRAGRLPDDALPRIVATVEEQIAAGRMPTPEEIATLVSAVGSAIRAIAPMTLIDLRAGRSPFAPANQRAAKRMQVTFGVGSLVLILVVAFFTQLLNEEHTALAAIQEVQSADPLEKLTETRKIAEYQLKLEKSDPIYDVYRRRLEQLRDLQDKIISSFNLAYAASEKSEAVLGKTVGSWFASPPAQGRGTPVPGAQADGVVLAHATLSPSEPLVGKAEPEWVQTVREDETSENEFVSAIGLLFSSMNMPPSSQLMHSLRADMAFLNGWLLPLLYGLLGAAVFQMRNLLDARTPTPDLLPALLRIALGGIAGIVIGWFWVPTESKSQEYLAITATPFGLAFLAGFSMDLVFLLLDRLIKAAGDTFGASSARSS